MTIAQVEDALRFVPADSRDTWIRVGMAVKDALGNVGFSLWDSWSKGSDNYDRAVMRTQWRSFRCKHGGVTAATLAFEARARGWQGQADAVQVATMPSPVRIVRSAGAEVAAERARKLLAEASYEEHPYLASKGFGDARGLVHGSKLLVPVNDAKDKLMSLQCISATGQKRFLARGRVSGGRYHLGPRANVKRRWFVEGYATGLTMLAAVRKLRLQDSVIVCFSAHGMQQLARAWRGNSFVIADHDEAGLKAARGSKCNWWAPHIEGQDANDFALAEGYDALAQVVRRLISSRGGHATTARLPKMESAYRWSSSDSAQDEDERKERLATRHAAARVVKQSSESARVVVNFDAVQMPISERAYRSG